MKRAVVFCVLVVFGLGLGAAAFELAVRALVPVSDFFWQWDPRVGLKHIPNKRGRAVKRGVFDAPVAINSHGFRDREHTHQKPPGTRRIVLLGDSFIEALQVPFERSVTPLLEARLTTAGETVELINLGVSGFGTARQYLTLRHYGLRYEPDIVALFFVGNDVSDNSQRLQGLPYVPYPVPNGDGAVARDAAGHPRFTPFVDRTSRLGFLTGFLRDHLKSYRLLRESLDSAPALNALLYRLRVMSTPPEKVNTRSAHSFGFHEIYRPRYSEPWAEAWALTESLILATRDLAEAEGARFVLVIVPAAWEVYPAAWEAILTRVPAMREAALDLDKPSRRLSGFLAANGIEHVALLDEFRARASALPPLYIPGDAHWTAEGHRLAAKLLSPRLSSLLAGSTAARGVARSADR